MNCFSKPINTPLFLTAFLCGLAVLAGCSSEQSAPSPTPTEVSGRIVLGPVVGADVEIFELGNLETPLCRATTTFGKVLENAGHFHFKSSCVDPSKNYLIVSTGGVDIDVDDNSIIDEQPTEVHGKVHAIITGRNLTQGTLKITALTESLFQAFQYKRLESLTSSEFQAIYDSVSAEYLMRDLNGDSAIDANDVLAWDPVLHQDAVADRASLMETLDGIHEGRFRDVLTSGEDSDTMYVPSGERTTGFEHHKEHLVLGAHASLLVIEPELNGDARVVTAIPTAPIAGFSLNDEFAFVALKKGGVQVVDVRNVVESRTLESQQLPEETFVEMVAHGEYVYGITKNANEFSLITVDVRSPSDIRAVQTLSLEGNAYPSIEIRGDRLVSLIATMDGENSNSHMLVFDVSDPGVPRLTASKIVEHSEHLTGHRLLIDGSQAYVLRQYNHTEQEQSKLHIYNLSFNDIPQMSETLSLTPGTKDFAVSGGGVLELREGLIKGRQLPDFEEVFSYEIPTGLEDIKIINGLAHLNGTEIMSLELPEIEYNPAVRGRVVSQGSVVGARVDVYRIGYDQEEPDCTAVSTTGTDLANAGQITFPRSCFTAPGHYLLITSGGRDVDSDNDGEWDSQPTDINGRLSTVMSSAALERGGWQLNPLTSAAVQMAGSLNEYSTEQQVLAAFNNVAELLLVADVNGDDNIDYDDVLSWNATAHGGAVVTQGSTLLPRLAQTISSGGSAEGALQYEGIGYRSSITTGNAVFAVSSKGNKIAAATSDEIYLLDIDAKQKMTITSRIPANPSSHGLLLSGDKLFVTTTDPAQQWFVNSPSENDVREWFMSESRLEIFDVSDPLSPRQVGQLAGEYRSLASVQSSLYAIEHNRLYRSYSINRVQFKEPATSNILHIDVSDVAAPQVVASQQIPYSSNASLALKKDVLFALTLNSGGEMQSWAFDPEGGTGLTELATLWDYSDLKNIPPDRLQLAWSITGFSRQQSTSEYSDNFDSALLDPDHLHDEGHFAESTVSIAYSDTQYHRVDVVGEQAVFRSFDRSSNTLVREFPVASSNLKIEVLGDRVLLYGDYLELIDLR